MLIDDDGIVLPFGTSIEKIVDFPLVNIHDLFGAEDLVPFMKVRNDLGFKMFLEVVSVAELALASKDRVHVDDQFVEGFDFDAVEKFHVIALEESHEELEEFRVFNLIIFGSFFAVVLAGLEFLIILRHF